MTGRLSVDPANNSECTHDCDETGTTTFGGLLKAIIGSKASARKPRIFVGPAAVVEGKLNFRRDVDLYVSDEAKIGTVEGATAKTLTGDKP